MIKALYFVGAKRDFMNAKKDLDYEQLKEHGCVIIINIPSSSHMGYGKDK